MAAQDATTEEDRAEARRLVGLARAAITDAVNKAQAAVDAVGAGAEYDEARGNAITFQNTVTAYQRAELPKLVAAEGPLFWFNGELVRRAIADGSVRVPADGENKLRGPNDGIRRTSRTKDTSATDTTQIANTEPLTVKSADFKAIMYADGKEVFSVSDDAEGGDEFRVDGYVSSLAVNLNMDPTLKTGLKMTADGPEIRTGGAIGPDVATDGRWVYPGIGDYLDIRKKISVLTQGADPARQSGALPNTAWDLLIKFDEPQTRSAASVAAPRGITSWAGNSEFHWRAVARPDPRQLDPAQTAYYTANSFTKSEGYERLGTYDLVLSNLVDVDRRLEPVSGSGLPANPDDDENYYLKYAAYGIFQFEPDVSVANIGRPHAGVGRVQTMHFGYEAFKDETGKKTTDISKALNGTFRGMTRAVAIYGDRLPGAPTHTDAVASQYKSLRGEVELTVNIPKSTGSGTLIGTMSNFEEWNGQYWNAYSDTFKIAFDNGTANTAMSIGDGGAFTGKTRLAAGATDPLTTTTVAEGGIGAVKGNFYGPRTDTDLEVAGSYVVGHLSGSTSNPRNRWVILGSFGAKQRPATSSSN